MDGSPEGPSSVAVVRKCSDGRLRALIAWADLPAEELQARLREWGPALATALCLPPGVPAVNPASVADPLEMARYVSAALGHDMRNIMSGIIGALELHRSAGQGVGEEVFDAVRRRAVEGVAMVEAMMGRLRTSQPEPAETVDLAAVVSDFKRDIEPLGQAMAASGVTFQTNGQPAQVAVDRSELYRALLALVFNSWRACRHGGAVEVVTEVRRGRAALEVRDDGEGMDPEVHRRAKEPFYTTEPDHHWGLGLTIAEEVAKQAHGSLMIRPREDRGTTVTLSLPLIEGTTGQHTPHRAPGGNKP
jgi:signal transduction histidine kinase